MSGLLARLGRRFGHGLGHRLGRTGAPAEAQTCRIMDLGAPEEAVYAVGDVHGCIEELALLIGRIEEDARQLGRRPLVVLLGDVIDRGPETAAVMDLVTHPRHRRMIGAILGNHERMMLDFAADPLDNGDWLDLGGFETLRSYGLSLSRSELARLSRRRAQQVVAAHLPEAHLEWLAALPHAVLLDVDGCPYLFSHAGYDASRPPDRQTEDVLLWGRGASKDAGGMRLVQGHVVVDRPDLTAARIRLDTGAWRSGRLTCLRLCTGLEPALLSVTRAKTRSADRAQDIGKGRHLGD